MFLFGDFYEDSLPPFSLNAVSSRNAVPNNGSGACVLVNLFVFVLNNVYGWKKGNSPHFFQNGYSTFILTCPNYIIRVSASNCFTRTHITKKVGLLSGDENGP